ncbi:BZ3500_MvSof-1268-A1-R1_Chr2-1g04183 [Microbotryum saponariae]|uniref:BZ3500_MvSof-1268-A1-R1_Chr2-1g04183 protein n=1 Tax=Microbotryum saponariae TaxID=289078 RepID=A0A2X0MAM6_9BASI|nr:BZ3500_MvSof-1268-A1-R1_Chr2-1g04183 [Microbotryum saponariae]SCZ91170.1 BZ3501_MvSof-1269-A2-R1_Chr2-1g03839 [Microbotryum saponariae]
MPPKASSSTLAAIESSTTEPEPELDLISFQLDLDESLAFAQALVRSWVPSKVDTEWAITTSDEKGAFNSLGQLTHRSNRSGRLGLGASASLLNQQQAQDQKLRNQLLRHTRTHSQPQDDDVDEKGTMGNRSAVGMKDEDGEGDEDSRSAVIRSRALTSSKVSDRSTRTTDKKKVQTTTTTASSSPSTSTSTMINPLLASGASGETSPIPSTSFYDNRTTSSNVASTSALTASTTARSAPPDGHGAKLTKNQRKKERDREKARLLKLQAMRESQRAEEEEGTEKKRRIGDVEDAKEERTAEGKKTKVEKASPVKNGRGPEGEEEGSSDGGEDDDDDDDDEGPSGNGEGSPNGGTKNKKKKKQRRKKKKGGPSPSCKGEGVLNLGK